MGLCVLFNDHPLVVPVEIANVIGLNEAIILQQIHYWCVQNKRLKQTYRDGYHWTYNSIRQWQEQFPFWIANTIRRSLAKLEEMGLIVTGNYNRMKMDKTKWYRVDQKKLAEVIDKAVELAEKKEEEKERLRRKGKLMIEACQGAGSTVEYTELLAEQTGREVEAAQRDEARFVEIVQCIEESRARRQENKWKVPV